MSQDKFPTWVHNPDLKKPVVKKDGKQVDKKDDKKNGEKK